MEQVFFERCARLAELLRNNQNDSFMRGYIRGLRRAYHGKDFGETEHEKYMNLQEDEPDISRRLAGQGYRAGYAGMDIIHLRTEHNLREKNKKYTRIKNNCTNIHPTKIKINKKRLVIIDSTIVD